MRRSAREHPRKVATALVRTPPGPESNNLVARDPAEAGRRSGIARRKRREEERAGFEAQLADKLPDVAEVYAAGLRAEPDDGIAHGTRIAAADRIANRLFGMPTQAVEHSGSVELDVAAARDRLAVLIDRRNSQGSES